MDDSNITLSVTTEEIYRPIMAYRALETPKIIPLIKIKTLFTHKVDLPIEMPKYL